MSEKILILGGTREAAELALELSEAGYAVITSLAGRTKNPAGLTGDVRIGGFGGPEKMAQWMRENAVHRVIDATHPFAQQISKNAKAACAMAEIPLDIRRRKPWLRQPQDLWHEVAGLAEAAAAIPKGARAFLALGSQHLSAFSTRSDVHFTVRMIDQPKGDIDLPDHALVLGAPSADWREESRLLQDNGITHIVCRNSGGSGAYAKIVAARQLSIPVIIINMPT